MLKQRIIISQLEKNTNALTAVRAAAKSMSNCNGSFNALTDVFKCTTAIAQGGDAATFLSVAHGAMMDAKEAMANWNNATLRDELLDVVEGINQVLLNLITIAS